MASFPDANYETTNCNKTFHRRERESHGVMRRGSLERNHNCWLSMDVACCGGGIGRRIAILSKKVVKYTVSTGEVETLWLCRVQIPAHSRGRVAPGAVSTEQ